MTNVYVSHHSRRRRRRCHSRLGIETAEDDINDRFIRSQSFHARHNTFSHFEITKKIERERERDAGKSTVASVWACNLEWENWFDQMNSITATAAPPKSCFSISNIQFHCRPQQTSATTQFFPIQIVVRRRIYCVPTYNSNAWLLFRETGDSV